MTERGGREHNHQPFWEIKHYDGRTLTRLHRQWCRHSTRVDRWLSPGRRRAEAQRRSHHLRRGRHPDHRPRSDRAGIGHPLHRLPARKRCGPRGGGSRLPDQEAGHLPDRVGARASSTGWSRWPTPPRIASRWCRSRDRASATSSTSSGATTRSSTSWRRPERSPRPPTGSTAPRTSAAASPGRSAPRCPGGPAASTSTSRPRCSARSSTPTRARSRCGGWSTRRRASCPHPRRWTAPSTLLAGAQRPLVVFGKGAAYAQADSQDPRRSSRRTGMPYLPMSMAKGLLPDDHPQSVAAARSLALREADVVMLVGARLNWLLGHGEAPQWNPDAKFIQVDIEADRVGQQPAHRRAARRRHRLGDGRTDRADRAAARSVAPGAVARRARAHARRRTSPRCRSGWRPIRTRCSSTARCAPSATCCATYPQVYVVNEGANTLDFARNVIDMQVPRHRLDSGTWGVMGIGMGYAIAAAVETGAPVVAIEGDSAFGFSGMELETICRYQLPIVVVVFNNGGVYRGDDVNTASADPSPTTLMLQRPPRPTDRGIRRQGLSGHDAGRAHRRPRRRAGLGRAGAHRLRHRPDRRHRKRPPRPTSTPKASGTRDNRPYPDTKTTPRERNCHHDQLPLTGIKVIDFTGVQAGPGLHPDAGLVRRRRAQGRAHRPAATSPATSCATSPTSTPCTSPCSTATSARWRSTPRPPRARRSWRS